MGEFVGRDGRPGKGLTWKLSDQQGRALAAALNATHVRGQFNPDYEQQSMLSEQNGQPAPASGWANAFNWRDGLGLFALNVQWTAKAKEMIETGEYKYISPVIVHAGLQRNSTWNQPIIVFDASQTLTRCSLMDAEIELPWR